MASTYDQGDVVRVTATWTDTGGTVADPTSVYFMYRTPGYVVTNTTYASSGGTVQRASTGVYYADVTTTGHGTYVWRFWSTGVVTAADQGSFFVRLMNVTS